MSLPALSIRNPVFAVMVSAAMIIFGWLGYQGLGVSQFPEIDFPVVSIAVTREAASPDIMDGDITDVVEDAETHAGAGNGMVAGRAHGDEGGADVARQHGGRSREHDGAQAPHGRFHDGVPGRHAGSPQRLGDRRIQLRPAQAV